MRILTWIANTVLLALLTFTAVSALGNLIGMPQIARSLNAAITPIGWFWLVVPVLLPCVLAIAALCISWRKPAARPLFLLLALTITAVWQIEMLYLIPRGLYFQLT